jgi:hypothetical protein
MTKNLYSFGIVLALSFLTCSQAMEKLDTLSKTVNLLDEENRQIFEKIAFKDEWFSIDTIEDVLQTYGHATWCLNFIIDSFQRNTPSRQKFAERGIDLVFAQNAKRILTSKFHAHLWKRNAVVDIESLDVAWRHQKTKAERKQALLKILMQYKGGQAGAIQAFCLGDGPSGTGPGFMTVTGLSLGASLRIFAGAYIPAHAKTIFDVEGPIMTEEMINAAVEKLVI